MQENGVHSEKFETFTFKIVDHVAVVQFNRPDKANALNRIAWQELQRIFELVDEREDARVAILAGEGSHFCSGIDLSLFAEIQQFAARDCSGRAREQIRQMILELQGTINAIEACRKPVLAAVHGACVGGGVDIVTACDMRYATADAFFAIAEIDLGMVADLGTLQRLPKLIGDGLSRELAYTGRRLTANEALSARLINKRYADRETMMADVFELARMIASKSPLAIRGTKEMINYTRDHSVADGLRYIAAWNAGMLLSNDLTEAVSAKFEKRAAQFSN